MKRARDIETIWKRIKLGCKYPYILKIRLTDDSQLLGTLALVDLLEPRFTAPPMTTMPSFYYSFSNFRDVVRSMIDTSFQGHIATESYVLTKILSEYFSGSAKVLLCVHIDEYPMKNAEETLELLSFTESLRGIQCRVLRNKLDTRVPRYRHTIEEAKRGYEHEWKCRSELESNLQTVEHELATRNAQLETLSDTVDDLKHALSRAEVENTQLLLSKRIKESEIRHLKETHTLDLCVISDELRRTKIAALQFREERNKLKASLTMLKDSVALKEETVEALEVKLSSAAAHIEKLTNQNDAQLKELQNAEQLFNAMRASYKEKQNKAKNNWTSTKQQYETQIKELQTELEDAQKLAMLETQSSSSQIIAESQNQLRTQLESCRMQLDQTRQRAERSEYLLKEEVDWNQSQSKWMQEERDRLLHLVQQLREQVSLKLAEDDSIAVSPAAFPTRRRRTTVEPPKSEHTLQVDSADEEVETEELKKRKPVQPKRKPSRPRKASTSTTDRPNIPASTKGKGPLINRQLSVEHKKKPGRPPKHPPSTSTTVPTTHTSAVEEEEEDPAINRQLSVDFVAESRAETPVESVPEQEHDKNDDDQEKGQNVGMERETEHLEILSGSERSPELGIAHHADSIEPLQIPPRDIPDAQPDGSSRASSCAPSSSQQSTSSQPRKRRKLSMRKRKEAITEEGCLSPLSELLKKNEL
ncbi:uncharacterized protein BYT42DRAFT_273710 [Radiomyces spectabilis]|uniref:uncharacterized protein n=1 Tax=Radiomyces spectabilis TaxID=64574 RepID=UPI00221ED764|nr:uncharacterized protein BYT42DRAFT_273710 [Radiomyces spectabilis]KAI8384767.1 hypothetical protein BYT42DRAFT_273710 [Radiomyces spectabilis]